MLNRRKAREEEEAQNRRKREREQKRKTKVLEKKRIEEEQQIALNIAKEERKILIAQRKLESIRLLSELIDRVKVSKASNMFHTGWKDMHIRHTNQLAKTCHSSVLLSDYRIGFEVRFLA